jgi:hypothetical protein
MLKNKIITFTILFSQIFFAAENIFAQGNEADGSYVVPKTSIQDPNFTVTEKTDPVAFYSTAVVQALNKITAKTSILEMKIGDNVTFGTLTIIARKCWKSGSDQRPESKILLEVLDSNNDKSNKTRVFYGWMFSSSPSISGLEHPIYDITAISCKR